MSRWTPAAGQPPTERKPWYDPSVVLGSSGPTRVAREDDADPTYEPPRVLGFTHVVWSKRDTGDVVAVAELGEPQVREPVLEWPPLLWDGDQA